MRSSLAKTNELTVRVCCALLLFLTGKNSLIMIDEGMCRSGKGCLDSGYINAEIF
jgi:hypothetical protein